MANQSRSMYIATYSWSKNLHYVGVVKPPATSWLRACLLQQCANMASFHWVRSICSSHSKCNPSRSLDKGICFLSSRHITAGDCFPINKPYAKNTSSSSSFTSIASHKIGRRNASQTLRTRCVVSGGGELVVGYGPSVVERMVAIVAHSGRIIYKLEPALATLKVVPQSSLDNFYPTGITNRYLFVMSSRLWKDWL